MLLGLIMVASASFYAILFALGKARAFPPLIKVAYLFAFLEFVSGLGMVLLDYLHFFWRFIILASSIIYLFIPPLMWKVVLLFHKK